MLSSCVVRVVQFSDVEFPLLLAGPFADQRDRLPEFGPLQHLGDKIRLGHYIKKTVLIEPVLLRLPGESGVFDQ
jgi:hypothetical protein